MQAENPAKSADISRNARISLRIALISLIILSVYMLYVYFWSLSDITSPFQRISEFRKKLVEFVGTVECDKHMSIIVL